MHNQYLTANSIYLCPTEVSDAPLIQKWHNNSELQKLVGAPRLVSTVTNEEEDIKNASKSEGEVYLMIIKMTRQLKDSKQC